MKCTSKLICFYLFFKAFSVVSAEGNCSEASISKFGFNTEEGEEVFKPKLMLTAFCQKQTGNKLGTKFGAKPGDFTRQLEKVFAKHGITGIEPKCLECFGELLYCIGKHCKGACLAGACKKPCQNCVNMRCMTAFLQCIGRESIPNVCDWEQDFATYSPPETGESSQQSEGAAGP